MYLRYAERVTRDEALRALKTLAQAPAAKWIGNRLLDGGEKLLQKCTRCGAEQTIDMPMPAAAAYQRGARGDALASAAPPDFDAKLYEWKRAFQIDHGKCVEDGVS
jgi:hypothetical protein